MAAGALTVVELTAASIRDGHDSCSQQSLKQSSLLGSLDSLFPGVQMRPKPLNAAES